MAEAGGTSTQSGILYQNTWAALYLGRLLDPRPRSVVETVISVRVETPDAVDDIVVTHTDGGRTFIQAKEALITSGAAWTKLWNSFSTQLETIKTDYDHLVLAVGDWNNEVGRLREVCHRAHGKTSSDEWWSSLSLKHKKIAQKIVDALHEPSQSLAFAIVSQTEVRVRTLEQLQEEDAPSFIPPSNIKTQMLFSILRDMVGGMARVRGTFFQADLLDRLQLENNISVHDTPNWGLDCYRKSITQLYSILSVPGTDVSGPIDDMFLWLPLSNRAGEDKYRDFEEEDLRWKNHNAGRTFDLRSFPRNEPRRAIIDASAGFGKTTLLHAIAHRLAFDSVLVPAIISLDAMAELKLPVHDYLGDSLNNVFEVALDWTRLCEGGRAVIFFDGLDELSDIDRSWTAGAIALFAARFPKVAWLLTVRDGSALPTPLNAQRLDIDRLNNEQIITLAKSYQAGGACIPTERLSKHMDHHPDLAHLLRIPLFLALVLATVKPEDDLPQDRTDILETYLTLLCAPERHKQLKSSVEPVDDLREAAEYLAFLGLEQGGVGLSEQNAKSMLRNMDLSEKSGIYIDRLLRFGFLRRNGSRLRFTYPIIQEYLAACWMVREKPELVAERFRFAVYRPWAQAIQFSLEMHPDSEKIIAIQLEQPDDVFHTVLRLIGRCLVNGAVVSQELKLEIGDKLADAWQCGSWQISERIGRLIADGFTDPLPVKVEALLTSGKMLNSYGGSEIIMAKNDETLTANTLRGFLKKNLEHSPWLHGWQEAVNKIAEIALEMYITRVKDEHTTDNESASIANLIDQLPRNKLTKDILKNISEDKSLPALIRVTGFNLGGYPMKNAAMQLIKPFIQPVDGEVDYWEQIQAAGYFWNIEGAEQEYIGLVRDLNIKDNIIYDLTEKLIHDNNDSADCLRILNLAQNVAIGSRHLRLRLLCAVLGDEIAIEEVINDMSEASEDIAEIWCWHVGHFNKDVSLKTLERLKKRKPLATDPISFISTLYIGLTYKMEVTMRLSGVLNQPIRHPAYPQFIEWFEDVLKDDSLVLNQKIKAIKLRKELGYEIIQEDVLSLLQQIWDVFLCFEKDDDSFREENLIQDCIDLIEVGMYKQCHELLRKIFLSSSFNASSSALSALARMGDEHELEWMVDIYDKSKERFHYNFLDTVERLASRLGKRVASDGDSLSVEAW